MKTIEKRLNFIYYFLIIIILNSCSISNDTDDYFEKPINQSLIGLNNWEMTEDILSIINNHRVALGQMELQKDTTYATTYAINHTKYMINRNELSHTNFFIRKERLLEKGATYVAENLAYGFTSAESVVNAWLNSINHKQVIEGDYTHVGFGIMKSDQNDKYYFTTLFYK